MNRTHHKTLRTRARTFAAVAAAAALVAVAAPRAIHAAIIAVSGGALFIAPPPSVMPGALVGPDIPSFDEAQGVQLQGPIPCDITVPGSYTSAASLTPGTLIPGPGLVVDSHYMHYDPDGFATRVGGARFDGRVICVNVTQANLDATNFFGVGTVYPFAPACVTGAVHCGLEIGPDAIQVWLDRVRVSVQAADPGDRVRVITCPFDQPCNYDIVPLD